MVRSMWYFTSMVARVGLGCSLIGMRWPLSLRYEFIPGTCGLDGGQPSWEMLSVGPPQWI